MEIDGYSAAIHIEWLRTIAGCEGADCFVAGVAKGKVRDCAGRRVQELICPCIRGEECICDALAEEFENVARPASTTGHARAASLRSTAADGDESP